jgi:hypothetical protein
MTDDEPTDENIEKQLAVCVRPPRADDYPSIRLEVSTWRRYGITSAELAELEDPAPAWCVSHGDLNRMARRVLTDAEVSAVVLTLDAGGLDALTAVLPVWHG